MRASAVVAAVLAALLVTGAVVRPGRSAVPVGVSFGRLPSVNLTSSASTEWDCPGPLPAGGSRSRSSIIVANPGRRTASVVVDVAAVSLPVAGGGTPAGSFESHLTVPPETERTVPLRTTGPPQEDAVSVVAGSSSVAVFESVAGVVTRPLRGGGSGRHLGVAALSAPRQAPCSTGPTTASYLAYGSTAGRSDVLVSLFNPTATQAVAEIRVATPTAVIGPPELQGLIVKPYSLQVFDLARSVVQQPVVGLGVSTTVGRVSLGASETIASDVTSPTSVSGQALLVGVAQPQATWVLAPGLSVHRTVIVCVYDPGGRPALVTISSRLEGGPLSEESALVPAGAVRAITLPVSPSDSHATRFVEGPIVLRTARNVGVVVARVEEQLVAPHEVTLSVLAGSADAASGWLLPLVSGEPSVGATAVKGGLLVANPLPRATEVEVLRLSVPGFGPVPMGSFEVAAGVTRDIMLQLPVKGAPFSGLEVVSALPVVVEQAFGSATAAAAGAHAEPANLQPAVPVQGVPFTR